MADDTSLNLSITSNTSDLEASLARIIDGLLKTASAGKTTGEDTAAGLNAVAAGADKAAASVEKEAVASEKATEGHRRLHTETSGLNEALEGLGAHSRTVSMGLEAMGLSAEGSAAKVLGMTEALSGLGKAVPELLLLAGAFAAVAGALDFWKEATTDAAAMQDSMARLGAAVTNQGGDWDKNKEAVEEWANSESVASGILKSDLIPALNRVVSAGHDLHDSQIIVGVAEELATQKGIDLSEATKLLLNAENNRTGGLLRQDALLKPLIASNLNFSDILAKVHQDMQGAIKDNESAAMTHRRLAAEMESVSEVLGNVLLPFLEKFDATMIGVIKNAQDLAKAISEMGAAIVPTIKGLAEFVGHDYINAYKDLTDSTHHIVTGYKEWAGMQDATARGEREIAKAIKEHQDALKNIHLDGIDEKIGKTPAEKKEKTGNPDATVSENIYGPDDIKATDQFKEAQEALDAALERGREALVPYSDAVAEATTLQQKNTAEANLYSATVAQLTQAHDLLNNAIAKETQSQSSLKNQYSDLSAQVKALGSAHDALAEKMLAEGGGTAQQKIDLADLAAAHDADKKSLEALTQKQSENTSELSKNTNAQRENHKATEDLITEHDRFLESLDAEKVKHQEALQDEAATYGKSIALQVAYYQQQLALLDANDKANEDRIKQLNDDLYRAQEDGYHKLQEAANEANKKVLEDQQALDKQLEEERKKSLEEATKNVDTFLDDILVKHESFATSLKGIMAQLQKQYVQSFSQMITGSTGFQKLFAGSGGVSGNAQDPNAKLEADTVAATKATSELNDENAKLLQGTSDASTITKGLGKSTDDLKSGVGTLNDSVGKNTTAIDNLTTKLGSSSAGGTGSNAFDGPLNTSLGTGNVFSLSDDSVGKLTGVPGGISSNSVTATQNTDTPDEFGDDLSTDTGLFQASAAGPNLKNTTGSDITGGLELFQGLSAGGSFGEDLSGAGTIVGGIFGGPVGSAIGGTLGSIIGSLFGPHPNASKDPDEFESTTGYGQDNADEQNGPSAASGVSYSPSSAIAAFAKAMGVSPGSINGFANEGQQSINSNGTTLSSGGIDAAEIWLSQNKNDTTAQLAAMNMTPAELASDISLLGSSATGSGLLTRYDKNIGDEEIEGAGTGGNQKSTYTAITAAINQVMGAYGAAGGSTGVYSLTHSLPSFEKTTMQQIGTFSDGIYTGSQPKTTPLPVGGLPGLVNTGSGNMHTLNVTVTIPNGMVVGANGMGQLADIISKTINKNYSVNAGNTSGRAF